MEEVSLMNKAMLAGVIVLGLAVPALVGAQETTRPHKAPETADSKSGAGDQAWMTKVAQGGMAEVELGKLATDKAASDEVKKFGQRMVDDHSKANDELKTLAQNKKVTLPTDIDAKHKAERDRLSKLSGAAFDRAYTQAMVAGHREMANLFRTESTSGKDPDVKAWAAKTLPTVQEHLKMAQQTTSAVGTSGTKKDTKK
jgi:putative membrane protein